MRYETHTHLKPEQVLDEAERFFGDDGLKMKRSARQGLQVSFFGPGLAWITVWPANDEKSGSRVDLDSSERDADVLRFRQHLHDLEHKPAPPLAAPPKS
jgi:hypothetical protein